MHKSVQCVGEELTTCVSRILEEGEVGFNKSAAERSENELSFNRLNLTTV